MAAGMATGLNWFKVPPAIKVTLTGKFKPYVSGKDVMLHLIGLIGVDGALYKSLEFAGPGVAELTMDDRFTIANMAIEAGAKNGIFPVDEKTLAYLEGRTDRKPVIYEADADAEYEREVVIDLSQLDSTVAMPFLPGNAKTVQEVKGIAIDQVVIGSCTNGRIGDMRAAAEILKGRQVADGVRCIVLPATQEIIKQMIDEGIYQDLLASGCAISTPTCGPCLGGHMGCMCEGEVCVSTTNRNFVGRMGHVESKVILASPTVAAASAVKGCLADPAEL
jgi:3-isopropylmalate/(R)-2-methylmalate dehydratase large subunit